MSSARTNVAEDTRAGASSAKPGQQDVQSVIDLYTQGRLAAAEIEALQLIEKFPSAYDVYNLLGIVRAGLEKTNDAVASYVQAITIKPDFAEAHNNLGAILKQLGLLDQAVESYRLALAAKPDFVQAHANLANALRELDKREEAALSYAQALRINPDFTDALSGFAGVLLHVHSVDTLINFKDLVARCFESSEIGDHLVRPVSNTILNLILREFRDTGAITSDDLAGLDPSTGGLLAAHLKSCRITDTDLELLLTGVRSRFLDLSEKGSNRALVKEPELRLLGALAYQGFINEHLWHITDDERSTLDALEARICKEIQDGVAPGEFDLFLLAAYRPLYAIKGIRCWSLEHHGKVDEGLAVFLKHVILEPERERQLGQQMERLTAIDDEISVAVRSQYEENPYPRWDNLVLGKTRSYTRQILKAIAPHQPTLEPASSNPNVLIAGCGTGKHPISSALGYQNCNILAVDLSRTSLAFAKRKAEDLKVPNIRFAQADILNLGDLEESFDIIECGGVLHHMADPEAGLKILLERLKSGGYLRLGLYSELARQSVVKLRQLVSEKAFTPTLQGIREFRHYARESKNPDAIALQQANDFYCTSSIRDLIFHVQEHRFTALQLAGLLSNHKLEFLGFTIEDPLVKSGYLEVFPEDPECLNLENWHRYEQVNVNSFARMYQFWCRKSA